MHSVSHPWLHSGLLPERFQLARNGHGLLQSQSHGLLVCTVIEDFAGTSTFGRITEQNHELLEFEPPEMNQSSMSSSLI